MMNIANFADLTSKQRKAIELIIEAEAQGVPFTRLLKTPYSCQFCGTVLGQPTENRDSRKLLLLAHEADCSQHNPPWAFACSSGIFYGKWMKQDVFIQTLEAARQEVFGQTIKAAKQKLGLSTLRAANELDRQITEGDKDGDRRAAAIAILDRAADDTASKQMTDTTVKIIKGVSIDDL